MITKISKVLTLILIAAIFTTLLMSLSPAPLCATANAAIPIETTSPTTVPAQPLRSTPPQVPAPERQSAICYVYSPEIGRAEARESAYPLYTDRDIDLIAKTVWGEARGTSPKEQKLVVWTILQRVDADRWSNTIEGVITARRQFHGYSPRHPVCVHIRALVASELADWADGAEPPTLYPFAPSVPYFYFWGDGRHNWFREEWRRAT